MTALELGNDAVDRHQTLVVNRHQMIVNQNMRRTIRQRMETKGKERDEPYEGQDDRWDQPFVLK